MADIERIKRNIGKMIDQGAPEADIDSYLASEGVTIDQLKASPQIAQQDDIYTGAAKKEYDELSSKGVAPGGSSMQRRILQGMTFNAADEILAGLTTPLEMIKRGTWNPAEGYRYGKARENLLLDKAREESGAAGTIAEVVGGIGSGTALAGGGATALRFLSPSSGLIARSGAAALDGLGMGLVAGAMEGDSLSERGENATKSGLLGGLVGAAGPSIAAASKSLVGPVISNIRARVNPEGYAQSQVARAITESGMTPGQITRAVSAAAQEGQPMFTMADAMGNPGQRMLSTVTRAPGLGRTEVIDFLDARQAGQGRRIAGALAEGFDTPVTAAQTRAAMTAARDTAADAAYTAARKNASPVNVQNVISVIDDTLRPGVNQIARPQSGVANDSIESALEGIRARLTDGRSVQTDFTALQRLRFDISDAAEAAKRAGQGNKARMLGQVIRELDASMERASAGFRLANRNFAQASRNIESIDEGATASMRGRTEDVIPSFLAQPPQGQSGFRSGYVDPLIQQAQGAAFGVNKARPLTNDAFRAEAAVMAPGNQLMQRRIGRENTMFETRNHAMGNSRTADNLADSDAMGVDPSIIQNALTGNWGGALRSMLSAGANALTGNTAEVRRAVGQMLLQRGANLSSSQVQRVLDQITQRIVRLQAFAQQASRGGMGGVAVAPAAIGDPNR